MRRRSLCAWIEAEDYTEFLRELSGRDRPKCAVEFIPATGEFEIMKAGSKLDLNVNESTTYGTPDLPMYKIAEKMLNQTRIVVMSEVPSPDDPTKTVTRTDPAKTRLALEKARQIESKFAEWIFADPARREKYEARYNRLFNALAGRKYDGSHLTFQGMAKDFKPRPHQLDCIARAVYGGNTLAAHVVGAGKSAVFISAVMKKKQLGLINKACVVVPKALTEQTAREWRSIFPDAKLLTVTDMDLSTPEKREVFTARIATGDYDAVIVSREHFDKMPMSKAYQEEYLRDAIADTRDMLEKQKQSGENSKSLSVKAIERTLKALEERLKKALDPGKKSSRQKDDVLEFEHLGFDYLVVDEAHAYKNGFVATKMSDVSGVTVSPSGRAQDMQMKCDYFNENLGQGHILYCTGTPVSNSMVELYVMTRYLRPDLLKAAGVERFDDWAATFGKVISAYKQTASGELKLKTTFSKFANLPELMAMYKEFADVQSAEKLHLPRPDLIGGKPETVTVPATPEQREYVKDLADRAAAISSGSVDPHQDNMLKITGEARLVGLGNQALAAMYRAKDDGHGELPQDFIEDEPGKLDECVRRVVQYYKETTNLNDKGDSLPAGEQPNGVQIIFSDIAVNSDNGGFSAYDYIRDKLIEQGIPANEIVFAPKADSKNRAEIFRAINNGEYRVVIGSTGTIGTGANIQRRLYACHHIDIPWKPSDFEQREGRILRQGNLFHAVRILNYVTEGTLDSYLYQVVTDKARFIAQLMDDKCPARVSEDCDDKVLTFAELQAAAEGNPAFRERILLANRIAELTALRAEHQHEIGEMQAAIRHIPSQIERLKTKIEQTRIDKTSADKLRDSETGKVRHITLQVKGGAAFSKREDINSYLISLVQGMADNPDAKSPELQIGDFSGTVSPQGKLFLRGVRKETYAIPLGSMNGSDNAIRITNFLEHRFDTEIGECEAAITKLESDLAQAEAHVGDTFPQEEELAQAQKDFDKLEQELSGLSEQTDAVVDPDEDSSIAASNDSIAPNNTPETPASPRKM